MFKLMGIRTFFTILRSYNFHIWIYECLIGVSRISEYLFLVRLHIQVIIVCSIYFFNYFLSTLFISLFILYVFLIEYRTCLKQAHMFA